jgi:hypothetical protein
MSGNELHTWHKTFRQVFPSAPPDKHKWYDKRHWRYSWRRVHMFNNGDLLAIWEGNGMVKLDKDSNIIWSDNAMYHHDLDVAADGRIYALCRKLVRPARYGKPYSMLGDQVVILNSQGDQLQAYSILEMFERSKFIDLLHDVKMQGDCFHTNTLEVLDGSLQHVSPLFKKGNVLISMRQFDTIAIADLSANIIVWAKRSWLWAKQHQPVLLANGNMLLFNNDYKLKKKDGYDASSVMEFDPLTLQVLWEYKGTQNVSFYSDSSSTAQRLNNGNTLITESTKGRAFEVTSQGEIVWEFFNPHRTGKNKELIAGLFELIRVPKTQFIRSLEVKQASQKQLDKSYDLGR